MSKKVEKSFEERLHSLKIGCIIFGILQILGILSNISQVLDSGYTKSILISFTFQILILLDILYMYQYTKQRNPLGPKLEYLFGALLLFDGIVYCLTIVGIIFGIFYIIISLLIFGEAKYFKNEIANNNF